MNQAEYIAQRNKELAGNIDLYNITDKFTLKDGRVVEILDKTANSLLVYIPKKKPYIDPKTNNLIEGVNSKQWFYVTDFEERFIKQNPKKY